MSENKTYYCYVSGLPIPQSRVEALINLGIPEEKWTVVQHSQATKKQGIYFGEQGSGELKIVRKVFPYSPVSSLGSGDDEDSDKE